MEYLDLQSWSAVFVKNSPEVSEMSQVYHQEVRITNPSTY